MSVAAVYFAPWRNRGISVGIVTSLRLDDRNSIPAGRREFFSLHRVQTGSGAHTASKPVGTGALSPWVKRPRQEAHHLPPPTAEVKNTWSCTSTHPYVFIAQCLVKYRIRFHGWYLVEYGDNFTLP